MADNVLLIKHVTIRTAAVRLTGRKHGALAKTKATIFALLLSENPARDPKELCGVFGVNLL